MDVIMTLEQIKKLTDVNSLNDQTDLIFKLGQIRGICDQAITDCKHEEPVFVKADNIVHIDTDNAKKTFADKCKEIMPEEPCTDDDKKIQKLLERNATHMNLKFELGQRFANKAYAKSVLELLAKDGICTMQDLMDIFDDPEKLQLIKYYQSANKDKLKDLNEVFPATELGGSACNKIALLYETANESNNKNATMILTEFIADGTVRHRNAIMRNGILNVNQLYYYLSHHSLKEYKKLRNVGVVPDSVQWLYNYISNRKVVK